VVRCEQQGAQLTLRKEQEEVEDKNEDKMVRCSLPRSLVLQWCELDLATTMTTKIIEGSMTAIGCL
jgi:hypothetical protein